MSGPAGAHAQIASMPQVSAQPGVSAQPTVSQSCVVHCPAGPQNSPSVQSLVWLQLSHMARVPRPWYEHPANRRAKSGIKRMAMHVIADRERSARVPCVSRLLPALALLAACHPKPPDLGGAFQLLQHGHPADARRAYDAIAQRKDAAPAEKVRALIGGALASDHLEDPAGARERLERAILVEVPGVTESALYYLGEHLRAIDRPRALNLYYRAAAGAQANLDKAFPYQAATQRILELSLSQH